MTAKKSVKKEINVEEQFDVDMFGVQLVSDSLVENMARMKMQYHIPFKVFAVAIERAFESYIMSAMIAANDPEIRDAVDSEMNAEDVREFAKAIAQRMFNAFSEFDYEEHMKEAEMAKAIANQSVAQDMDSMISEMRDAVRRAVSEDQTESADDSYTAYA